MYIQIFLNRLNNNIDVMNTHPVFRRSVSLSPSRVDGCKYREALAPVRTLIRESFKVSLSKTICLMDFGQKATLLQIRKHNLYEAISLVSIILPDF